MGQFATIFKSTVYKNGTGLITALLKDITGANYSPSDISSIKYSIYNKGVNSTATPVAVTGHTNVPLSVGNVMFAPENKTYDSQTFLRNFEWIPDISENDIFTVTGNVYQVRVDIQPVNGFCSPMIIEFLVI